MPTIKLHLSIGYSNASREDTEEIDDDLWESLNEKQRNDLLEEIWQDWSSDFINGSAQVEE
jgi:hypothetical protein